MSDRQLILALAKVIIAAAWADGEVTLDEVNSLKDLLFRLPHGAYKGGTRLTGREWAILEMYLETPVDATERTRLVEELKSVFRRPRDRELALLALEELIWADGAATEEEMAVLEEIESALGAVDLGVISQVGRLIRGPVQRRSKAVRDAPNREKYLEDFLKNKVYYSVQQRLDLDETDLDIRESDLRKLSLAGGLMARVAHVDQEVTEDEFDAMVTALAAGWDVGQKAAAVVAEVAVSEVGADLDYYRLTREFTAQTTQAERARFLDVLFAVASADGQISSGENEEIRRIASSLNLTRQQFVNARLKATEDD
jgi:uncharacterized tellurite resistance protein B-like protein